MLKFEYQIKLNDDGRPYIDLPEDYQDAPEDKFMAIELTRYILISILNLRGNELPDNEKKAFISTLDNLEILSDEFAHLLKKQMESMGDVVLNTYRNYHIMVDTIKNRNNLNYNGIVYKNKIYKRKKGFKVLVLENMKIYELVNGIDNENWKEVNYK